MARRSMDYLDGFGAARPQIYGPLIGGGLTQAVTLATKLLFKKNPKVTKWSGLIGLLVGGGVSGVLAARENTRETGFAGLLTAALVAVPRQIEDMMAAPGSTNGYLGVITPEQSMAGFGMDTMAMEGMGAPMDQDIQLLDASPGTMGVITPEQSMSGFGAGGDEVELMGAFGSNFMAAQ